MDTAFILYQLSIITTMLSIMSVPYNSSIISHEKMNAFAYISISDVVFKLLIVYIVIYLPWDKLLLY
ncbi:lipopolysaccharide biosynthesis protein, partial [Parabacteroides distasonis]|nr:lipopolysaccharide biosynthesis protein [Parabacteroides distasonis]